MTDEISETDRIERDLAKTRARRDGRLDELQDHLTPKQMLNDAFAYFRGSDCGEFASDLIGRAKANPLPVAHSGIGIAWRRRGSRRPACGAGRSDTWPNVSMAFCATSPAHPASRRSRQR